MVKINTFSKPPVVVLGLSATGLAVGRIFSARGVKVYGTDREKGRIGRYSKYINKPPFGYLANPETLLDDLIAFANYLKIKPVLFPADDAFIEFINQHVSALKKYYLFQSSYERSKVDAFLNKKNFYQLCEQHGVAVPRSLYLNGNETIENILKKIRLPFIIKPDLIHLWKKKFHGKKVILIETVEEFEKIINQYDGILPRSTIQEVIPGPESNIYLFKGYFKEDTGDCIADFTGQKIRQVPVNFGSGSLVKSVANDEVRKISIAFLKSCEFKGLCGSEFKYDDRDKTYKMIEVNIRAQLWEDLTRVALRDVLWYAYTDLVGLPFDPIPEQKYGVTWSYMLRDFSTVFYFIKSTKYSLIDWVGSYRYLSTDAVLDIKDPLLTIAAPVQTFIQVLTYLRGR
jgi:D-aspartate ligase